MRIAQLHLEFFGHFTDKNLDFRPAGHASDFHLIYGLNEAGKTTIMEAYLRLLYGFPHREPYEFQHQRKNLRVSGILEIDGQPRLFKRLPSRNDSLRDIDDVTLPETAITAPLGGLSPEDYRSLLCLDDNTIEQGGEDIANARGELGKILFSATAGIAELNAVLEQARAKASDLYKKRARTTRIAELKREIRDVNDNIRNINVNVHALRTLKTALDDARHEAAQAQKALERLRAEQNRTDVLRRALPNLGELDQLVDEIAAYSEYPDRIDINPEELVNMMTARGQADAELQRLKDSIGNTEQARAALVLDQDRLALADQLDQLDESHSRMQTAASDLPRRQREHEEAFAEMIHIARDLGAPRTVMRLGLSHPRRRSLRLRTCVTRCARPTRIRRGARARSKLCRTTSPRKRRRSKPCSKTRLKRVLWI